MRLINHLYHYPEQGMLDCNTFLIQAEKTLIVDVGLNKKLPFLIGWLQEDGLDPHEIDSIVNTHLHIDHIWANEEFKKRFRSRIELAPVQRDFYDVSVRQASRIFGLEPVDFQEDGLLDAVISLGDVTIDVLSTPGHSPDSICFYCREIKALICGDLMFDRSIGRSDLPGGSSSLLKDSIEKMGELEIDFLLPGHMGILTDRRSIKDNFDHIRNTLFRWL